MEFSAFIEWVFYAAVSGSAIVGVRMLSNLNHSIQELNTKVGIIIERTEWLERGLEHHEARLSRLEKTK
jgi:hypothetical protein